MPTFLPTVADMLKSAVPATPRHGLIFGTTGDGPPDGPVAIPTYIQDLQTLGLTMNRTYLSCNFINTSSGVFNWAYRQGGPDLWYTTMIAAGITPILQHIFAPTWWFTYTSGWTNSATPYADWPPYPSTDWNNFMTHNVDFATAAAIRYPLAIIEISNEWNNGGIYVKPQGGQSLAVTAANYAAYHAPIQAAYKAVNPNQKVIVGGLLRMDSANFSNWVAGNAIPALLKPALDALSCTPDGVSIHPYMLGAATSNPTIDGGANILSRNYWQSVGRYLDAQDAAGWHLPVYITETGFRASGFNSQNAFNCNSETTKAIWNRYEPDNTIFLYTKDARPAGKSWVEAYMYYRTQEYPSPTATSLSGAMPGDPAAGPHPLNAWGASLQDVISRYTNRQPIPVLDSLILTGVPSTAVVGQTAVTISAAGGNIGSIPTLHTTDATVVSLGTPATGSATTTIAFPAAGTATIYAESANARRVSVNVRQTIVVAAQVPSASVITPGNGWLVATSNGGTITFTATATDQIGNPIPGVTGTWSSSDATNAPIDPVTGILTAVGVSSNVVVTFTPTGGTGASTSTGNVVLNPVLQITNPPSTLINVGAYDLVVTDGVNPVTSYTIVINDASKATQAGGTTLVGKGTSGTFTVKVTKATYNDSALATVTCTGDASGAATNSYFDDKDLAGLTNGVGVSTYTDGGGYAWAQSTSTKRPLANTNDVNGHTSIIYDGVDDYLQATSPVASMNGSGFTYARLCYPTSTAPSANEQQLDNRDTTHTEGFVFGRNTVLNPIISYYTGSTAPHPLSQNFDGSGMFTANAWHVVIDRINQGEQSRMLDGVVVGTSTTLTPYVNATTSPVHPTKGGSIFLSPGNNAAEHVAPEVFVNRGVPDLERLQIHRRITLYQATAGSGGTPAVTSVSVSPSSFTVASGSTQNLTASSLDQFGNPIADTYTWLSSNTGQATVNSSGVVTGVATGSPTITATSVGNPTTSGTSAATVTSGGSVTAVNISYNAQQAPILARTGSTYTLVAKDQSGNVLTGGTWSSSDATNAPINSSGVAAPATGAAGAGITWTYTDTGSGHAGTLAATVLKAATNVNGDIATNYTSDTNFLASVANSVPVNSSFNSNTPTGSSSSKYYDGNYCNQIQIDPTRLFMGVKTFRVTVSGSIGPTLRALLNLGTGYSRLFCYTVNRFEPGFTMVGTSPPMGADAYKITPWFTWPPDSGRCGPEGTNGNSSGGTGGAPGGTFDLGCNGTNGGLSTQTTYAIQGEFSATNPQYYLDVVLYETRAANIISARHFHCPIGSSVVVLDAGGSLPYGIVEGPMQAGFSPYAASVVAPFGENFNKTAPVNIWRNVGFWGVVNGTSVGDPLGIFGTQPTPTLTSVTGGTLTHGTNTNTVTFTGTNFNENCFPLFSNAGVLVQSITLNSSTSITAVVNVTSGASLGASTVLIKNSASMTSTSTQPILIL